MPTLKFLRLENSLTKDENHLPCTNVINIKGLLFYCDKLPYKHFLINS